MTKMAAMPIYGKNPSKIFFTRTSGPISTKLGMKHRWLKHYNVYINHDPVMTLICSRSQVSVYRTIGPLVFKILDTTASVLPRQGGFNVPKINVLSKNIENLKSCLMKFSIFKAELNLVILHGHVLVMRNYKG